MTTLHAGRYVKLSEYHLTKAESGRTVYVDPSAVVAIGEVRASRKRWGKVRASGW